MQKVPERLLISHFFVFFLIHSMQMGVGILGFQRRVAEHAENDAWISIIIAGIGVHLVLWMIYKILEKGNGDLTDIHRAIFGKWLGGILSFLLILYFTLLAITVLRTYIEIVQVWIFPDLKIWFFGLAFIGLVYYVVNGGFRVITGIAFFGVILPSYLIFTFFFPMEYTFFENLLPIMDHSVKEILLSSKSMTLSILGFEAILLYYPFIKNPSRSKKWAHFGVLTTTFIYLFTMIVSIGYFSLEQLQTNIWASLTILKIVELPFVERIEYIGISSWIIVVLPNICLAVWAASRVAKRIFKKKQRPFLILLLLTTFVVVNLIQTRQQINMLNDITANIGFYLLFAYIPFLFLTSIIYHKVKGSKEG